MTGTPRFAIGIDFGTSAARALMVDTATGEEIAAASSPYPSGDRGVVLDPADPNLARQQPADYAEAFADAAGLALRAAEAREGFRPDRLVGLGIDATGSTPLPVDGRCRPVASQPPFGREPAAMAWLWKDHTSHAEAEEITAAAADAPYLASCGGAYSSEWFWAKALRFCRTAPGPVRAATKAWIELSDYIPAMLSGVDAPGRAARNACAAGHKGLYHPAWGGLPPDDFLARLHADLPAFRHAYAHPARTSDRVAGRLSPDAARASGLPEGLPVAVGLLDAHAGAIGAGVAPGVLVKIMGTSTCDCLVAPLREEPGGIPGVSGVVPESIIPGMLGIEAGQSAVGDIFDWFVTRIGAAFDPGADASALHAKLTGQAASLTPGESGLLALDWHNGNRNVLADPRLTGLILGLTLHTTPAEIYRALIEATAFGARTILDRLAGHGVAIDRIVNCGGIAEKSPLVMQIYADVCDRPMHIARSGEACALGAAVCGAVAGGAHPDIPTAQAAMTGVKPTIYTPDADHASTYDALYAIYTDLHDTFGGVADRPAAGAMKRLIEIRDRLRQRRPS